MERSTRINVEEGAESSATSLALLSTRFPTWSLEVYKFSQEIGAATNEQSVGSSQIAKATSRLTEITQEINSAVEDKHRGASRQGAPWHKMRIRRAAVGVQLYRAFLPPLSRCSSSPAICSTAWIVLFWIVPRSRIAATAHTTRVVLPDAGIRVPVANASQNTLN